ncbi:hypothetical protein ACVI3U_005498 [Sinorhizobium medicae]
MSLLERSTSAAKNSFQALRKAKIDTVAIPGITSGSSTLTSSLRSRAPSMRAASSISLGTASKALRIMKTEKGSCSVT